MSTHKVMNPLVTFLRLKRTWVQIDENAKWKRIGYVVSEEASEVLGVINIKEIVNVQFAYYRIIINNGN